MSDDTLTPAAARAILGLQPGDDLAQTFRAAAKLAHPDRPGGDAARFRQVLDAYRLLQSVALPAVIETPRQAAYVEIDAFIALRGGEALATMADGRRTAARIPPGARHGETLNIMGTSVSVRIIGDAAMQVRGSDLWVTSQVAGFLLEEGGRATLDTPLGPKMVWISRRIAQRRLIRLEGQGLPARGAYPVGSLFVRLTAETVVAESPARTQLRKFAAAWAA